MYGFLDDELPCDYYKELFFNQHEENKHLRQELSNHIGGVRMHEPCEALTGQQPLQDLSMELIYQEMNGLKSKAKVYDSLLLVVFGLIIVLIMCLIIVSFKN